MVQSFHTLFEIQLSHDYFQNKVLSSMVLRPTLATELRIKQAAIILKKTASGLKAVIQVREINLKQTISALPAHLFPLVFSLQSTDAYFENYSDLPLKNIPRQTYYLHSQTTDDIQRLHQDAHVGEKDLIDLKPLQFDLYIPESVSSDSLIQLIEFSSQRVLSVFSKTSGCVKVDLRQWGPGYYVLQANQKPFLFFYADNYLCSLSPWGILEISQGQIGKPYPFTIRFAARKTHWRYIIIKKYRNLPFNLAIVADHDVTFKPIETADSSTACFESDKAIPLSEYGSNRCKLIVSPDISQTGKREQVILSALPQAGIETIKPYQDGNETKISSEIYVYL